MGGRRLAAAIAAVLALGTGAAEPDADVGAAPRPLTAEVGVEWAVGTRDGESQKLELRVEPTLKLDLPGNFQLGAIGRLRGDAFDRLEPGAPRELDVAPYTRPLDFGDRVAIELRELYVQGKIGPAWLRAGKQQVVWGQADGLKVLDVVDPQDFREFILPSFEDSRIPLWTLNGEIPIGPAQLQLLWIPDPSAHHLPPQDGTFAFSTPRLVGAAAAARRRRGPARPRSAERRAAQLRRRRALDHVLARLRPQRECALALGGHPDCIPQHRRERRRAARACRTGLPAHGGARRQREQCVRQSDGARRGGLHHAATSCPSTIRAIATASPRPASSAPSLGFDWYGIPETLLSAQVFQTILTDHPAGLLRDRIDTNRDAARAPAVPQRDADDRNDLDPQPEPGRRPARPKVSYELRDDLQVWLGVDLFYGTRDGVFGEFGRDDRVVLGFEWGSSRCVGGARRAESDAHTQRSRAQTRAQRAARAPRRRRCPRWRPARADRRRGPS